MIHHMERVLKAVILCAVGTVLFTGPMGPRALELANAAEYTFQVSGGPSKAAHISRYGRYVVFHSVANDLVDNDTNGVQDIFLHDRDADEDGIFDEKDESGGVLTIRVNVDSAGNQAMGGNSANPAISDDGRFVVFQSLANNLVPGTTGVQDIFVHDRDVSDDGTFDEPGDIKTVQVSVDSSGTKAAAGDSANPAISDNGRFIAFQSSSTDLVPGTTGVQDIFVHDRDVSDDGTFDEPGDIKTVQVSVDANGNKATAGNSANPAVSNDGRFVTFESAATNLVVGDTNGSKDIFVHDRDPNDDKTFDQPGDMATVRVSVRSDGTAGNGPSTYPDISYDGRFVTFQSAAANLVVGDTNGWQDIFLHDRDTDTTTLISVDFSGTLAGSGESIHPAISQDGRFVAFQSAASNLVVGDTNGVEDVFLRDCQTNVTTQVSVDSNGNPAAGSDSARPAISADDRHVAFQSNAHNLVDGDTNGLADVFVHDRDVHGDNIFDEPGDVATVRISVRTEALSLAGGSLTSASSSGGGGGGGSCFISTAGHGLANLPGLLLVVMLSTIFLLLLSLRVLRKTPLLLYPLPLCEPRGKQHSPCCAHEHHNRSTQKSDVQRKRIHQ
jgi:Tol biopolymer transport system component